MNSNSAPMKHYELLRFDGIPMLWVLDFYERVWNQPDFLEERFHRHWEHV